MNAPEAVRVVVIGIGNEHRRDDGVGPAVAARVAADGLPGVRVLTCPVEPAAILDAWDGAELAILVDAAVGDVPGRVRQCALDDLDEPAAVSSHDLGLRQTYALGGVLRRLPATLRIVTVGVVDTGPGVGLGPLVAAALPDAVRTIRDLVTGDQGVRNSGAAQAQEPAHQQP